VYLRLHALGDYNKVVAKRLETSHTRARRGATIGLSKRFNSEGLTMLSKTMLAGAAALRRWH
jgi:hypothetical protein